MGIDSFELDVFLGSNEEECRRSMDMVQACEIHISSIHNVHSACLQKELVQDMYLMDAGVGDIRDHRDAGSYIQQGMKFYTGFSFAIRSPWEQRETQVDKGGIQSIDGLIQFDAEVFLDIEFPCLADEHVGKIFIDSPIPGFICVCQCTAGDVATKTHVVKLRLCGSKTGLDVTEAFPVGQLSKRHAKKLVPAGETFDFVLTCVTIHTFHEIVVREKVH